MNQATAFAPGNLSCLFVVCPDKNPAIAGSLGMGFTVNKGVTVTVGLSDKTGIFFNGLPITFPTVLHVVDTLAPAPIEVKIETPLPLGSGFGLSGASAIATAYALNSLFGLKKTNLELAKFAHMADVMSKTGLGDVVNEYYGGFFVKFTPSSQFVVTKLPITGSIYCKSYDSLPSPKILGDEKRLETINSVGRVVLSKIQKDLNDDKKITLATALSYAKEFSVNSGLLTSKKLLEIIEDIESREGHASMIILGNAIMSDIPFEGAMRLAISTIATSAIS